MLYFAYGSLMSRSQLERLCPDAKPLRAACVPNHYLAFLGHSKAWEGGTAAIRLSPGHEVWGGVYEIDEECRSAIERAGEPDGYVWALTRVHDADGERIRVGLLVKVRDMEESAPAAEYLDVIKKAWEQWGLNPTDLNKHPDRPI